MTQRVEVRALNERDREAVVYLDDMSGNYLEQWLEDNEDYAWGLFRDNQLIGYCSTGYADDCGHIIEEYNGYSHDSVLLSDVFILPEFRHQGYGFDMMREVLKMRNPNDEELVFLQYMNDDVQKFYQRLGFRRIGGNVMVRDFRPNSAEIDVIGECRYRIDNQQMAIDEMMNILTGAGLINVELKLISAEEVEKEDPDWFDDWDFTFEFTASANPNILQRIGRRCGEIDEIAPKYES